MARNKYHAKKVAVDGYTFDSHHEAERWKELRMLERAGAIQKLRRQVVYVLIPAQREEGTFGPRGGYKRGRLLERDCTYKADFVYEENGQTVVEDAKGMRTAEYIIKRKLMLYVFGIKIKEV